MRNIRLLLAYEGSRYLGWQKTAMGPSIEETVEKALSQVLQHEVKLQAASRTDGGVHAEGQVINFFTPKMISLKNLNSLLPSDISILAMEEAAVAFHPTLDARGKEYFYSICLGETQLPFHRNFSWHFTLPLDLEKMKKAAKDLVGEHDFSAFTNQRQANNVRILHSITFDPSPNRLKIRVAGNNFLYKMVRNIVGTLLYVGCGKIESDSMTDILKSQDRSRAGVTAPAHGLVLKKVFYD